MTLILSELYTSVQGEGPNVGLPTQFVRFASCNLRCPGWPCDTQHAIDPAIWRKNSERLHSHELIDRVPLYPTNLCLTGGEPFLQSAIELQEFCEFAWIAGHTIEVFTNGTNPIPKWARGRMRVMMDWKLPGSGEYDPENRIQNYKTLHALDGIKFVVKDMLDLQTAIADYVMLLKDHDIRTQFYVTPVWASNKQTTDLVEFLLDNKLPWKLSLQMHKYIWDPEQRGV